MRKLLNERSHAPAKDLFDTGINVNPKAAESIIPVEILIGDSFKTNLPQLFESTQGARVLNYIEQQEDKSWSPLISKFKNFIK